MAGGGCCCGCCCRGIVGLGLWLLLRVVWGENLSIWVLELLIVIDLGICRCRWIGLSGLAVIRWLLGRWTLFGAEWEVGEGGPLFLVLLFILVRALGVMTIKRGHVVDVSSGYGMNMV